MLQHDKRCPSNILLVRDKSSCLQELSDLFIIKSPSPLNRTEGSSLLVKTRQGSSSPKKTNERKESSSTSSSARNELLCPFWVKEEIPWLPQHLKEAESPFQLHEEQESSVCLLVDNKREQSSWSSALPLQEIEERQLSRSEDRAPVTFKRRDWSSPQPSTRHEQPCPRPLKQEQSPLGVLLAKDFLYFLLSPHFI